MRLGLLQVLLLASAASPTAGQLVAARDAEVAYGHHHVNASDIDAHERFWIDALGGTSIKIGTSTAEVVSFPNVLVFLADRAPTGGTKGTVVNHVGFETRDIRAAVARLRAGGFRMVTREELPETYTVTDDLAQRPGGNVIAFVMGPDETKVELIENTSIAHPIQMHHVHWAAADGAAMQAWYVEHFGAAAGTRINQPAADLPGVNLTFAPDAQRLAPTRGRALDHIGFEVRNLEAFVRGLEAKGVRMDRGYTQVPALGIAIAFLTDPVGNLRRADGGARDGGPGTVDRRVPGSRPWVAGTLHLRHARLTVTTRAELHVMRLEVAVADLPRAWTTRWRERRPTPTLRDR